MGQLTFCKVFDHILYNMCMHMHRPNALVFCILDLHVRPVYGSTHRNWSAHRLEDTLIKHGSGFHITRSAFIEHGSARLDQSKLFKLHKAQAIMSHNLFMLMLYETSA